MMCFHQPSTARAPRFIKRKQNIGTSSPHSLCVKRARHTHGERGCGDGKGSFAPVPVNGGRAPIVDLCALARGTGRFDSKKRFDPQPSDRLCRSALYAFTTAPLWPPQHLYGQDKRPKTHHPKHYWSRRAFEAYPWYLHLEHFQQHISSTA